MLEKVVLIWRNSNSPHALWETQIQYLPEHTIPIVKHDGSSSMHLKCKFFQQRWDKWSQLKEVNTLVEKLLEVLTKVHLQEGQQLCVPWNSSTPSPIWLNENYFGGWSWCGQLIEKYPKLYVILTESWPKNVLSGAKSKWQGKAIVFI